MDNNGKHFNDNIQLLICYDSLISRCHFWQFHRVLRAVIYIILFIYAKMMLLFNENLAVLEIVRSCEETFYILISLLSLSLRL